MPSDPAPSAIIDLAERRAAARRARDWKTADALRAEIENAGWSIVDAGTLYTLRRSHAEDVREGSLIRYGSSRSVPSRLEEPATATVTVVLLATDWPDDLDRATRALTAEPAPGAQLVIVANGPSPEQATRLQDTRRGGDGAGEGVVGSDVGAQRFDVEVVWLRERLGHAAALNAGIRRATGEVVVVLDTSIEATSDILASMVTALNDPTVAVVGPFGLVSADLRRFEEPAPAGKARDVVAIEGYAQAFRRADYVARGPLDEHFAFYRNLDIWWSLVLRDQGPDETEQPRRAVALGGLSLVRHEHRGWTGMPEVERDRLSKRNFYRILKRFATRRDLLLDG